MQQLKSAYKQSKTAHCLTLQGYKDQPTTLQQAIKTSSFWSLPTPSDAPLRR